VSSLRRASLRPSAAPAPNAAAFPSGHQPVLLSPILGVFNLKLIDVGALVVGDPEGKFGFGGLPERQQVGNTFAKQDVTSRILEVANNTFAKSNANMLNGMCQAEYVKQ